VVPLAKFAEGVVDIGGRFSTGVVDTPANLPPVSLIANISAKNSK
jgi:hypothetical protein